jgi:hypothetical protein
MSCCGSLFVNLGGGGGGTVNTGVLQIAGGVPIDTTLRFVEDQNGTDSPLKLSTGRVAVYGGANRVVEFDTISGEWLGYGGSKIAPYQFSTGNFEIQSDPSFGITFSIGTTIAARLDNSLDFTIGSGTLTRNGKLTIKGSGGNIASFRDSSNVEQLYIDNAGQIYPFSVRAAAGGFMQFLGRSYFDSPSDGIITFRDNAGTSFNRFQFGGTTTDFPAIAATNTPATLAAKDATGTNLIPFSAEDFKSANLSAGTLNTARTMQFGDKGTVTTGNDLGLDAQIAVEHNGNVYYIPCSTVLLT